jgi:hypothetical protein
VVTAQVSGETIALFWANQESIADRTKPAQLVGKPLVLRLR